jgi:hypothetical protein
MTAAALLRGLRGLDDESARVTITLWTMDAEIMQGKTETLN